MFIKKVYLLVLALGTVVCSISQEKDLDPVVVSGNLSAQKSRETGRNIMVIRQQEIRQLPVHTLDDLLKFMPGIEVQQRGPQGAQADITIRGGTFQQVLVVVDGIRLNDPITGHFNAYIPVHPQDIDRIEIVKGAASAVFGPDAVGGVIHIITKTFQQKYSKKGIAYQAGIQAGSYDMRNAHAHARMQGEKSFLSLGYQRQNTEGMPLRGTRGFIDNNNLALTAGMRLKNEWTLMLRGALDRRYFNAQNFYTAFLSDTANERVNSTWQQLRLEQNKGHVRNEILLGGKQLEDTYYFRPSAVPNNNRSRLYSAQFNRIFTVNSKLSWLWGGQVFYKGIRSNDRGNHDHTHLGLFSGLTHRLGQDLVLNESVRLDWDQRYQWVLIPQVNFSWSPSRVTLRSSIGRSVRDADFTERFNNFNKSLVASGNIGNPYLSAEKAWNMEVGMDVRLGDNIEIRSTAFRRSQSGLIDWVPTPFAMMPRKTNLIPAGNYALASNISSVVTQGVELDLQGVHGVGERASLRWSSGLIYLDSRTPQGTQPSFYLSSHARFLWNANLVFTFGSSTISLTSLYKERQVMRASPIMAEISKSYFLTHLRYDIRVVKGLGRLFVQCDNLGNVNYADLLGSKMPGRWWSVGVRFLNI